MNHFDLTCVCVLPATKSAGHVDYWPNNGRDQPGCPPFNPIDPFDPNSKKACKIYLAIYYSFFPDFCNHGRSWAYYAESLSLNKSPSAFAAVKCNSWSGFTNHLCTKSDQISFMGYDTKVNVSGDFYLQTNCEPKYSRDIFGIDFSTSKCE